MFISSVEVITICILFFFFNRTIFRHCPHRPILKLKQPFDRVFPQISLISNHISWTLWSLPRRVLEQSNLWHANSQTISFRGRNTTKIILKLDFQPLRSIQSLLPIFNKKKKLRYGTLKGKQEKNIVSCSLLEVPCIDLQIFQHPTHVKMCGNLWDKSLTHPAAN